MRKVIIMFALAMGIITAMTFYSTKNGGIILLTVKCQPLNVW